MGKSRQGLNSFGPNEDPLDKNVTKSKSDYNAGLILTPDQIASIAKKIQALNQLASSSFRPERDGGNSDGDSHLAQIAILEAIIKTNVERKQIDTARTQFIENLKKGNVLTESDIKKLTAAVKSIQDEIEKTQKAFNEIRKNDTNDPYMISPDGKKLKSERKRLQNRINTLESLIKLANDMISKGPTKGPTEGLAKRNRLPIKTPASVMPRFSSWEDFTRKCANANLTIKFAGNDKDGEEYHMVVVKKSERVEKILKYFTTTSDLRVVGSALLEDEAVAPTVHLSKNSEMIAFPVLQPKKSTNTGCIPYNWELTEMIELLLDPNCEIPVSTSVKTVKSVKSVKSVRNSKTAHGKGFKAVAVAN